MKKYIKYLLFLIVLLAISTILVISYKSSKQGTLIADNNESQEEVIIVGKDNSDKINNDEDIIQDKNNTSSSVNDSQDSLSSNIVSNNKVITNDNNTITYGKKVEDSNVSSANNNEMNAHDETKNIKSDINEDISNSNDDIHKDNKNEKNSKENEAKNNSKSEDIVKQDIVVDVINRHEELSNNDIENNNDISDGRDTKETTKSDDIKNDENKGNTISTETNINNDNNKPDDKNISTDVLEENEYKDIINGNRCYVDDNSKTLYYITECQSSSVNESKCKYTKKDGKNDTGTVLRNKLKYESACAKTNNDIVTDGNIIGATGFSALNGKKYLMEQDNNSSKSIVLLEAGVPFKILGTNSNDTWWKVEYNGEIGYVENAYCMINLPDYIPSIQYDLMNAKNNIYTASGVKLSIYGKQLYKTGRVYNPRLERDEYIVPVVYSFAKKILDAQNIANKEGYGLKIYDGYRPKSVADEVRDSLASLYYSNSTVRNGIDYSYENGRRVTWGQGWFIAQNLSSHSVGAAIDVVLVDKNTGKELPAQSSIHDLSTASVKYNTPISGQTVVRNDLYSSKANKYSKDLDRIMLSTGMTNLASEWWHFQDNEAYRRIKNIEPSGLDFQPTTIVSSK